MLEYESFTIDFDGYVLLEHINLKIDGKNLILGPNGSGKTTLIRATCGLLPYKGNIYVNGNEVRKIRNYIDLSTNLYEVYSIGRKVKDIVYILEEIKDLDTILFYNLLKELRIHDQVINKPLHKLSAGQSSMVRIALTLSSKSKIALVDEPFENLDPGKREIIADIFREYFNTGFITTHELDLLKEFKEWNSYIIFNGKIYGPILVEELIDANVVEGEVSNAIVTIEVQKGKKISLVKDKQTGIKISMLGSLNRIYGVV
ncbi:ATP-binding cassette domain-containing protein [Sulfolobus tengchongensis]|uniref:ATP-binding cassette domain-containing protein n=1 Tax=Sulfolobus tengchongensis TaxID=207809 RepID=A0AAX4KWS2_9CREN